MSEPIWISIPLEGSSNETRLMSSLDALVMRQRDDALDACTQREVSRAVAWLASKYVMKDQA